MDQLDEVQRLLDKVPPPPPTPVHIPGILLAYYQDGKILNWTFIPHGSDAGYFGPAAQEMDRGCALLGADEPALDVESTDGPFWRAVQDHLISANPFSVEWEE